MPGTNYEIETGFMDKLPLNLRDAALDLITYSPLNELLKIRTQGPNEFLQSRFFHSEEEWQTITRAVILTKLTYFTPNLLYPDAHLDRLIQIARATYRDDNPDLIKMYQATLNDYPTFARWLKSILETQQQKNRQKKAHAKKA